MWHEALERRKNRTVSAAIGNSRYCELFVIAIMRKLGKSLDHICGYTYCQVQTYLHISVELAPIMVNKVIE